MSNKIYPMAYKLLPGQTYTLYYLAFPETWKRSLLEIARQNNPKFKDEHGLPTNALAKLLDSWMDGIVALGPLKKSTDDSHWLISCRKYSEKELRALYAMIQVWIKATYVLHPKSSMLVKKLANDFCDRMRLEDLGEMQESSEVCLTLEDGTVCAEAYQTIPLIVTNRLLGQDITLGNRKLHLCHAAKNQLISEPITDVKSQHSYSFVFDFSVQTTPPNRKALLLCQMSIRRWIPDCCSKDGKVPYLAESINAYIQISPDKYCMIPIAYDKTERQINWKAQDRECYNIWGYKPLPEAKDVITDPAAYATEILLPYKNGMYHFTDSKIGTGVSVVDKAALYQEISMRLHDMLVEQPVADRIRKRGQSFPCFKSPQEYETSEDFRRWVRTCAETDEITFELYGLAKNAQQHKILENLKAKISQDFGTECKDSCMKIQIIQKETGDLADGMPDDKRDTKILRCDEIVEQLGKTNSVTGAIFILPEHKYYEIGDPKQVIRNAFARTGRVVQFINPEGKVNQSKIEYTVYDLYRQLGIVTLLNFNKKIPSLAKVPCIGMHLCTQVHGIAKKGRYLPIYVTVDVLSGKTSVHCDAFSNRDVSYRDACLEMAQLFWKSDLEQRCVDASRSPAKQKLIECKNRFYDMDHQVLLFVQSDGNTRSLWSGISDKEIGNYTPIDSYCPAEINVGMPKNPYPLSLTNTGVRVIRIRSNQEVPDYYTELSSKNTESSMNRTSASGLFQFEDVYWGIHGRNNDGQYIDSVKLSRIDYPEKRFAEKDMIEFYPLQLQSGDDAATWVSYADALRDIPIQFSQSTNLPLPLHLAKALEEYLFDA